MYGMASHSLVRRRKLRAAGAAVAISIGHSGQIQQQQQQQRHERSSGRVGGTACEEVQNHLQVGLAVHCQSP
ncbi:hypothetical protein WJX73_000937 [Symbiochloris irregularis]|uniref:Secreted protein n=1 Tax=Symbiochloris irregularis TaxID=706552 RepID=A0AAW1NQQ4_9CHLO